MSDYNKVIFICTGNTCRSPMAEMILKKYRSDIEVISRGLVVLFQEPANPKASIVMENNDFSLEHHCATQFTVDDVTDTTLIITMTEKQKEDIQLTYGLEKNIVTLSEYTGEQEDIQDPYGGSIVEYETCYRTIARLVKKVAERL